MTRLQFPDITEALLVRVLTPPGDPAGSQSQSCFLLNPHETPEITLTLSLRSSGPLVSMLVDGETRSYQILDEDACKVVERYSELRGFWYFLIDGIRTHRHEPMSQATARRLMEENADLGAWCEWFLDCIRAGSSDDGTPVA